MRHTQSARRPDSLFYRRRSCRRSPFGGGKSRRDGGNLNIKSQRSCKKQLLCACRKTSFYDTETDSCARASCQKAPLFDTRESIGEKSVAHVPGFFRFLLKSASPEKSYRLLQQAERSCKKQLLLLYFRQTLPPARARVPFPCTGIPRRTLFRQKPLPLKKALDNTGFL